MHCCLLISKKKCVFLVEMKKNLFLQLGKKMLLAHVNEKKIPLALVCFAAINNSKPLVEHLHSI